METLTKTDVLKMLDKDIISYLAKMMGWKQDSLYPGKWSIGLSSVFYENPIGTSFESAIGCLPPDCTWSCSLTEWHGWSSLDICCPSIHVNRSSDSSLAPMEVKKLAVLLWEKEKLLKKEKEINNQ